MSDDDDGLICPITQEVFRDPVLAEDGHLYEREAITRWINQNGTSPFTRQVLNVNQLKSDEEIRKKADQRRRLSVTYNRESDQVRLPPTRSPRNIHFVNRIADIGYPRETTDGYTCCQNIRCRWSNRHTHRDGCWESVRNTYSRCCLWRQPNFLVCICITVCVLIPFLVIVIVFNTSENAQSTFTSVSDQIPPVMCYALTYMLPTSSCMASFTNITYLDYSTCNNFTYQYMEYDFIASSNITTIIFAFQQTSGYWDIDNITLSKYNTNKNIFQNGGFESGFLSPDYNRCQSVGYISNSSQFSGRYCYSDHTNGTFGYLMQSVSTTVGSPYYLEFYLQNRDGSGSSFMVLVDT